MWQLTIPTILTALIVLAVSLLTVGCGNQDGGASDSGSGTGADQRVINAPTVLSVDDLAALGMKVGKTYDVGTLEGATGANLLYWRVQGTAVEFEVRFYENHDDAVALGTDPAQEGSGENAIIDADYAVYTEGIRDRRTIFDTRGAPKPKYGAYGIFANIVMLCEGLDDAEAWGRCQALIDALSAGG